ncbi:carbohydrate ABC transporter permease [Pseudarthrobacter sp. DSP2-3-2b1]|uniref:carbohydrate ABC transporter permease n=1 Tax=Pseudarthrobacter sp. DSP2-3-2b1 TaxID=2804661 RepID=UPI003CEC6562
MTLQVVPATDLEPTVKDKATRRRNGRLRKRKNGLTRAGAAAPWWFILPALAFYTFAVLVPSARGLAYSFTDWNGLRPVLKFIGFDNYAKIFADEAAASSLVNTLFFALAVTILQNGIGLLLALGVHRLIKSRNILRVILFTPAVLTPVVTAYVWKFMFAPDGPINSTADSLGIAWLHQDWLGNPALAPWAIVMTIVWQFSGYSMVIFLAGLQGIPEEIYEASAVDGAGSVRQFFAITRPLLAPAITVNLMLSIIGGLKLFDQIQVMTGGGPGNATVTLSGQIYKTGSEFGQYSYSIAMAVILTIAVAFVSGIQYKLLARQENR